MKNKSCARAQTSVLKPLTHTWLISEHLRTTTSCKEARKRKECVEIGRKKSNLNSANRKYEPLGIRYWPRFFLRG